MRGTGARRKNIVSSYRKKGAVLVRNKVTRRHYPCSVDAELAFPSYESSMFYYDKESEYTVDPRLFKITQMEILECIHFEHY
jgi:hypothetical protein